MASSAIIRVPHSSLPPRSSIERSPGARLPFSLRFPAKIFGKTTAEIRSVRMKIACGEAATMLEELGILHGAGHSPALSTSYRDPDIPRPNQTVLEAQARVCTGPTQTKPLPEEQMLRVLDTIVKSARGELEDEDGVSKSQLGAFFAAMTIRANSFPEATQWSDGERSAMNKYWPRLMQCLPSDVLFLADPEGTIMGASTSVGPLYTGQGYREMRLVGALREVLAGGHLGYEEVQGILQDTLPTLTSENGDLKGVDDALLPAFLIGQRMNGETDRELKAYCLAFDDEIGPSPIADVRSLTHYGEPYDGNTRFFRSTLFVAAVRSSYGECCLLHGAEWMPPRSEVVNAAEIWSQGGVTDEQMLKFMGATTRLSPAQAAQLIEDEDIGFAYISQREARPSPYSLGGLREHIKKRPPVATSEKVQQYVRTRGKESIVAGFYHEGYEDKILTLMRRRGVHCGLVIKGEEGGISLTTKTRSQAASKGLPVNYCSGFRSHQVDGCASKSDGIARESFRIEVDARTYGFEPSDTPRTDRSVLRNIELGLAALRGERGSAYDRIVLNAGLVDHLLGNTGAEDVLSALDRAREAIDSGKALKRLMAYIQATHKLK